MENLGGGIVYPTVEQICEINRRMIDEFGGLFMPPDNLLNAGALEYILAVVSLPDYGIVPYSTPKEKASAIAFHIISRHVFHDGNKRTATQVAWEFLQANGIPLFLEPSIVELTKAIARGDALQSQLLHWLRQHQEALAQSPPSQNTTLL